jgi:hypothetical protein
MIFTILLVGMITIINTIKMITSFKKEGSVDYFKIIFPLLISTTVIYILIKISKLN